jgi:hypothetical protein
MNFTCDNVVEGEPCGHITEFDLQLRNIKFQTPENHNKNIKLTEKVGVVLKYPTLQLSKEVLDEGDDAEFNLTLNYIDYIYDEDQIYKAEETPKEELKEFLESLSLEQIKKIKQFFITTPTVVLNQDIQCSKCGYNHHINVEGVLNFFE